jgi:hypothetical protein
MEHTATGIPFLDEIDKAFDDLYREYDKMFPKKPFERILGTLNLDTLVFEPYIASP